MCVCVCVNKISKMYNNSFICIFIKGGLEVLIDGQTYQGFDSLTNASVIVSDSVAVSRPEKQLLPHDVSLWNICHSH